MTFDDLSDFFGRRRYPSERLESRGPSLPLERFSKDDRYLVSEMACKSYNTTAGPASQLKNALLDAWKDHCERGGGPVTIRELLEGTYTQRHYADEQTELVFSADDILSDDVSSEDQVAEKYERVANRFHAARDAALRNTRYYLSMVNELDVYVATSMRTRDDFRQMADLCETIFNDSRLKRYNIRYFDPTLSAAEGHEDKGLIECLMVKSAKILLYSAGRKESWGKDAEAAMALSLGKPVIFLCDEEQRSRFYRDVHPLSRLIEFESGVAVGAMVTDRIGDVAELVRRILGNDLEYQLEQPKPGYFRLVEKLTRSVVRLQTSDVLLRETFWNYYHGEGTT
jgi:hypothetical protein